MENTSASAFSKPFSCHLSPRWIIALIVVMLFLHTAMYQTQTLIRIITWNETTVPVLMKGCPDSLIFLEDTGRMGNRFFEFLAAKILAEQLNRTLYISQQFCDFLLSYFNGLHTPVYGTYNTFKNECGLIDANISTVNFNGVGNLSRHLTTVPFVKLTKGFPDFIPSSLWNVLHDRREELLQEFRWRSDLKKEVVDYIKELTANHTYTELIGVHVRMTDYHAHMSNMYGPSKLPGANYFNKSMTFYRRKLTDPLFLVVSNDMKWCQNTLKDDDVVFAGKGNETDPGWDLALLASCDHLIVTYGSYGTMAAYFIAGKGEVVAADNFTTRPNTFSENIRHSKWPNWHWMSIE